MIKVIKSDSPVYVDLILIRANNKQKLRFLTLGNDEMFPISKEQALFILQNLKVRK